MAFCWCNNCDGWAVVAHSSSVKQSTELDTTMTCNLLIINDQELQKEILQQVEQVLTSDESQGGVWFLGGDGAVEWGANTPNLPNVLYNAKEPLTTAQCLAHLHEFDEVVWLSAQGQQRVVPVGSVNA